MTSTGEDDRSSRTSGKRRRLLASAGGGNDGGGPVPGLPAFCDLSASVSVAAFGARRMPEISDLWQSLVLNESDPTTNSRSATSVGVGAAASTNRPIQALKSGGGKTSSRHLRRRATSYQPRRRHRFPAKNCSDPARQQQPLLAGTVSSANNEPAEESTSSCRRKRRRNSKVLSHGHEAWHTSAPAALALGGRDSESSERGHSPSSVHWMMTHTWHAKRFHMETLWGWRVPLIHTNRGGKAAIRLAQEKSTVQDFSWCQQPIWLRYRNMDAVTLATNLMRIFPDCDVSLFHGQLSLREGMMHEIDSFPNCCIGPVTCVASCCPLFMATSDESQGQPDYYLYFMSHPAMQPQVLKSLETLVAATTSSHYTAQGPFVFLDGGMSCLRLTGTTSFQALENILSKNVTDADTPYCHVRSSSDTASQSSLQQQQQASSLKPLLVLRTLSTDGDLCKVSSRWRDNDNSEPFSWLIVHRRPRDPILHAANCTALGFDILCPSKVTRPLWQALVVQEGACPIGITEQVHLAAEAEPPLTVFPRDFPDTEQGRAYWDVSSMQWRTVRTYFEGGPGRINRPVFDGLTPLRWAGLFDEDRPVVVIRGRFGHPIRDILTTAVSGWSGDTSPRSRSQKLRRPVRAQNSVIQAPRLSLQKAQQTRDSCLTLLQHLSLPAVLLCCVHIVGPGVLEAGMRIYAVGSSTEDELLGFVTSGSFSGSRGLCQGTGIIGVARFLRCVSGSLVGEDQYPFAIVTCQGGVKSVLRIVVQAMVQRYQGVIYMLL